LCASSVPSSFVKAAIEILLHRRVFLSIHYRNAGEFVLLIGIRAATIGAGESVDYCPLGQLGAEALKMPVWSDSRISSATD
jgi:hypothetical protein